jgi:dsRNA-specific ribonuclease
VWRRLAQLEASLGYCFREKRLLREAFTHAAYANEVGG